MKKPRITVKVREKGPGIKPVVARIGKINSASLKVGIMGGEAMAIHEPDINAEGDVSLGTLKTNVEIASYHEFGTAAIPQRSFIRATVDAEKPKVQDIQRRIARGIVSGRLGADEGERLGLSVIGEHIVNAIKERIRSRISPPLSPKTVAKKGSSTPLINTGQLIGSITYEVRSRRKGPKVDFGTFVNNLAKKAR